LKEHGEISRESYSELAFLRKRVKELEEDLSKARRHDSTLLDERKKNSHFLNENCPDIITRFDKNLKILYVNLPIMAINPRNIDEYPGKSFDELGYPKKFVAFVEEKLQRVFDTGRIHHDQFEIDGLTGHFVYDLMLVPEFDQNSEVESVVTIARDVTELVNTKMSLSESEKRLFFHVNQTPLAYIEWGADLKVVEWNGSAEKIFGYCRNEVIGRNAYDFIVSEHKEVYSDDLSFFDGVGKIKSVTKYGKSILCEWYNSLLFDENGQITGMASLIEEVAKENIDKDELHKSRQKLSFHFRQTPLAYIEWDTDFKVLNWNPSAERIFEYKKEEIIGKEAYELIIKDNDTHKDLHETWGKAIEAQEGFSYASKNMTKSGKTILCEWYNSPISDTDGQVVGLSSLAQDITDKINAIEILKKSEKKYMNLVETTRTGFFVVDSSGNVLDANGEFAALAGFTDVDQIIGRNASELVVEQDLPLLEKGMAECIRNGYVRDLEMCFKRKNSLIPVEINATTMLGSQGQRIMGLCRDISSRKNMESELIAAKKSAEDAARAKSDFLANMSHEIRTPLNGVIGMSYLLAESELQGDQKEYLDNLNSSAEILMGLIEDILDFSQIEAGMLKLEKEPFSLRDVTAKLCASMKHQASSKGIDFLTEYSGDLWNVTGDSLRIRQVFMNLVGNAIKFTSHGQVKASINSRAVDEDFAEFCFEISDTGIGISDKEMANLFGKFTQADTSVRRCFGGTGLGLAISNELVKMMDGDSIKVQSKPGEGSVFSFKLQLPLCEDFKIKDKKEEYLGTLTFSRPPVVLLVEDNSVNQKLLHKLLSIYGCKVDLANHGKEAVDLFETNRYDLVFMDIQMPVLDGFAATARIRKHEKSTDVRIPVIAMTAHALRGYREKCLTCGMDDYISKPIKKNSIKEALLKHCAELIVD